MENKRKEGWEAYIHDNGTLQVKRYCEGIVEIELDSPFVKCYLGTLLNTNEKFYSREEAEEYFKNNNKKGK